jgi:hypothetical protein
MQEGPSAAASWTTVALSDRLSSGKTGVRLTTSAAIIIVRFMRFRRILFFSPFIIIRIVRAKKIAGIMP